MSLKAEYIFIFKAENLLLEKSFPSKTVAVNLHRSFLVDFGLSRRVRPPFVYKEQPKKGHDGTLIFTSIDAHRGVALSYRTDVEILGYNLMLWLTGTLPWMHLEAQPEAVQRAKEKLKSSPKTALKVMPYCRLVDSGFIANNCII